MHLVHPGEGIEQRWPSNRGTEVEHVISRRVATKKNNDCCAYEVLSRTVDFRGGGGGGA